VFLVVQIEDGVEAGSHVEVVLAAVLPQPLLREAHLLEPPADLLRARHHCQLNTEREPRWIRQNRLLALF
jgi:hypothetical protein